MRRILFTALLLAAPRAALACPVCFGASDAPLAKATNLGILVMLGVVVAVLAGFATFIVTLYRRGRLAEAAAAGVEQRSSGSSYADPQEGIAQC
jgi:hypothetical protein